MDSKGTALEAGLIEALSRLLLVAGALNTRHEADHPEQTVEALVSVARNYGATVRALEQGDKYGWTLTRLSDHAQVKLIVPARPQTDDMLD